MGTFLLILCLLVPEAAFAYFIFYFVRERWKRQEELFNQIISEMKVKPVVHFGDPVGAVVEPKIETSSGTSKTLTSLPRPNRGPYKYQE